MRLRAPLTTVLLAVIVVVFALDYLLGGGSHPLLRWGADSARAVAAGQWWRLVTSLFLHLGLLHLAVNGWALYQLGTLFEIWLGSLRLAVVFFTAGIAGSLASLAFTLAHTNGISAGASGAIFGILGALITFLALRRGQLRPEAKSLLFQLLFWAAVNVYLGFTVAVIDNSAHLGGFAAGLVLGLFLRERAVFRPASRAEL
jgi:membrane associated rhomboid family serine protease